VLALLAFALAAGGWLRRADRLVYDAGLALASRPAPDDIVIVAIDDASIEAIGRWPWKRSVHATLLERLAAARPRSVVLDLVLSEPDPDPRQDELLAAALRHAAPVVMPVSWQAVPGEPLRTLEPVPALRSAVVLGAAEAPVDADGVLRHAFVDAGPSGRPYPHLAVAALRAGGEAVHPRTALQVEASSERSSAWVRQGQLLIRFSGPPGHLRHVSYVDVLRGAVPAGQLAGRHLLVGMTAQGLGDTLATPVNGRQRAMPGVEVLAHTMDTLRRGDAVRALSPAAVGAVSAAGVLALVVAFGLAGTRLALGLAVASLPLLASLAALVWGPWCSPVAFMLTAALAYPLWSWRRLERGVAVLDREIAELAAEPGLLPQAAPDGDAPPPRDRLAARLQALHRGADTLRAARRFLADALAGLPTAMLVEDGQGRVLLANPLAATLFEVEGADELQGLDLARLLGEFDCEPAVDWPLALAEVRRTRQGLAVQARLAGQGDHVIHAHGVPLHEGTRLIVAVADVAPIKRAEREREQLLAFVSHDLRAPAMSISLLADLHLGGRGTLGTDDLLREVRRLAQRTLSLADDFVRVAQAAQRPLQLLPADPLGVVTEAMADFEPQARAAGVQLQSRGTGLPLLPMDRALVLRALGNLLSNAIRHAPAGSVVNVQLSASPTGGCVLAVADEGPGLDAAAMQRLIQSREGLVPASGQGVGFGLLFVQRVAQRHRGALAVRAGDNGRGCVFELTLDGASGNP
jgi:CHASE2 domain-containing sensor protein/signal transduction histidine kinase